MKLSHIRECWYRNDKAGRYKRWDIYVPVSELTWRTNVYIEVSRSSTRVFFRSE